MRRHRPIIEEPDAVNESGLNRFLNHSLTYGWCLVTAAVFAYATIRISKGGEFLYFNF